MNDLNLTDWTVTLRPDPKGATLELPDAFAGRPEWAAGQKAELIPLGDGLLIHPLGDPGPASDATLADAPADAA